LQINDGIDFIQATPGSESIQSYVGKIDPMADSQERNSLQESGGLQATHISIDINDSMQLEAQGLKRVQIEGFKPPNGTDD